MRMQDNYRGGGRSYKKTSSSNHAPMLAVIAALLVVVLALVIILATRDNGTTLGNTPSASPMFSLAPSTGILPSGGPTASPSVQPSVAPTYQPQNNSARIVMVGDFLLHETTTIRSAKQADGTYNYKPYFEQIKPYLQGDLVIGLMETPVNANGDGTEYAGWPRFNAPQEIAAAAKWAGINTFITSNNHALDCDFSGLVNTIDNIKKEGIDPVGTYKTAAEAKTYHIKEYNGIKIGIVAYTDNGINTVSSKMGSNTFCMNIFERGGSISKILSDINAVKAQGAEFVIVSMHWGIEYQQTTAGFMKEMAQKIIEGGADIIMGTHPHCVQEAKTKTVTVNGVQKEVVIAYSLGNFFADQRARLDDESTPQFESAPPMTEEGMILTVDIEKDASGKIVIKDAYYTPTYAFRRVASTSGSTTIYDYAILPAGKYALAATRPAFFKSDAEWQEVKDAWTHTTEIVGSNIRANSN